MLGPLLALLIAAAPAPARTWSRAVWIWEPETYRMLEERAFLDLTLKFLRARRVDRVFLYADAHRGRDRLRDEPERYRRLVRRLRGEGIASHALLLGSVYLETEQYAPPEKRQGALAMLLRVLEYNAAADRRERFDGVHLDIEPHLLSLWEKAKEELLRGYLERSAEWTALAHASGTPLTVSAAIPFWFDTLMLEWGGRTAPMNEHVQRLYDAVVLMDYRDRAEGEDGIIAHARHEVACAEALGRRVMIGIETSPATPAKVTFLEEGPVALEGELERTAQVFASSPALDGFCVHHLRTWMDLWDDHRHR